MTQKVDVKAGVQTIKIDPKGKQLLVFQFPPHLPPEVMVYFRQYVKPELEQWIASDSPVFIMVTQDNVEIRLEKIEGGNA